MLTGDSAAALAFLLAFEPEGPWCLTSIHPDKKALETKTFKSTQIEDLKRWIEFHNGHDNMYFHVNPVIGMLTQKATREQIAAVNYLHVDVDPKKGADIEGEQQRILGLLTTGLKKMQLPVPTFVIFSGGGYQAFWKLDEPIVINGDIDKAEEAKLFNKQLEILFNADNCHNIDRIMRLPGTVNLPDKKKREAGRSPALARIVQHNDVSYPLSLFSKAVLTTSDLKAHEKTLNLSGNIQRVNDLNDLDHWDVPNRVKVVIAQGKDPDEPLTGDNSRSAWLWYALCEMARKGVPPDVMYSLITDPDWPISASVLDKGRSADADAQRQIARAQMVAENPALLGMNEKHACVVIGAKFRIATWKVDPADGREFIEYWEPTTFKNVYATDEVEVGKTKDDEPIKVNIGEWWLGNKKRRAYEGVTFAPHAGPELHGYYNLWQGFKVDAKPGECDLFLQHCRDVLCSGKDDLYTYLLGWMARMVQKPGRPGEVAIVLRGERGAGKSFFANTLGSLFGRHYMAVSNSAHLVGNFNAHLREIVLLFADEAFFAGDKKHESVLKTIITEPRLVVEKKGVDVETAPNCLHLIMASNDFHVIPVGRKERRFFVLDVSEDRVKDEAWFNAIGEQLDNGGREALLNYLLHYDLSGFSVRAVPTTNELKKQLDLGLSPIEAWWKKQLEDGRLGGLDDWPSIIPRNTLFDNYYETMQRERVGRPLSSSGLGTWLHDMIPGLKSFRRDLTEEILTDQGFKTERTRPRQYHYEVPSLDKCRAQWDKKWGKETWPEIEN